LSLKARRANEDCCKRRCGELHRESRGAFDIAVGPLVKLWGFYRRQGQMPSWEGRLSPLDRKILTLYLFDLRRTER
jgi:hypothetical protein